MTEEVILSVRNLEKQYPITEGLLRREVGRVRAVDGVSFELHAGEAFGLVGESGCGKSTTALSLLRLEEPTAGEIRFHDEDVLDYSRSELREYRRRVQLVLQDPDSAFNPRLTVGEALEEPLRVHGMVDSTRRKRIVTDALERVGLDGDDRASYPHEFSGGQKQRIALARALVVNPDVILADEPVSALDGRTKADVLELLGDLQTEFDLTVLLISHDVDVVRRFCDRIGVMYLGKLVECGPTQSVLETPHHPYTRALLSSVPSLDAHTPATATGEQTLTDDLPNAADIPSGCRFHPRCRAIIPPEEWESSSETWRRLMELRLYLEDDWSDTEALGRALADGGRDWQSGDGEFESRLRTAFELPETLPERVEDAVADAGAALARNDLAGAREQVRAVTATVCEQESPSLTDEYTSHTVACHRYDPEKPGEALDGTRTRQAKEERTDAN